MTVYDWNNTILVKRSAPCSAHTYRLDVMKAFMYISNTWTEPMVFFMHPASTEQHSVRPMQHGSELYVSHPHVSAGYHKVWRYAEEFYVEGAMFGGAQMKRWLHFCCYLSACLTRIKSTYKLCITIHRYSKKFMWSKTVGRFWTVHELCFTVCNYDSMWS